MQTKHFKIFTAGQPSFRLVRDALPELQFEYGMQRGFLLSKDSNQNVVRGRYVYTVIGKQVTLDPETLEVKESAIETLTDCNFEISQQKALVSVEGKRGHFNALYEALDAIPNSNTCFEELNLNLLDLISEVQGAYKKNVIKSIRIRDYLARENMMASATFKIIEKMDGERIMEKFADQLDAVTLIFKLPDGACSLSISKKGTVKMSDDGPDELMLFVKDLLPRFHEAEVETAEVVGAAPIATR